MNAEEEIRKLRRENAEMRNELKRVRQCRIKSWKDRKSLHGRLMKAQRKIRELGGGDTLA